MQNKLVVGIVLGGAVVALGAAGFLLSPTEEPEFVPPAPAPTPPVEVAIADPYPVQTAQIEFDRPERGDRRGGPGGEFGFGDIEARLAQFDKDGDGIISREERRAAMEAMRAEFEKRMDKNGDGVIDENERLDAMLESPMGQRLKERFDANGDGMIDETERAAIQEDMARREAERQQRMLERWDADGDGQLSEAEEQAARQQEQQRREQRMQELSQEFDMDGDGELNEDERADAFQTMRERREIDAFVGRYDSNGDSSINTADFNAFLTKYQAGDTSADVNRDGAVDTLDVSAFRDMMSRASNRP